MIAQSFKDHFLCIASISGAFPVYQAEACIDTNRHRAVSDLTETLQQHPGDLLTNPLAVDAHGGQRGVHLCCAAQVAEAHDGEVFRDAQMSACGLGQHALGYGVRRAHHHLRGAALLE